ncbi:MAG TPA: cyclic nucleotide-binding domain-containing protein [Nostocaceae cyanobacterium]|nr:cyclic nucleotide-binding domain-containing protein [Nostocaceae cyanobacterium]
MQTVNQPTVLTYQSEEVIVQQGDPANKFYILLEGEVNIMQESADQPPRLINHLKRGDYFGEVGLLQGGKRTATVRVVKDSEVKVMVIEEEMFQNFLSSSDLTNSDVVRRVHQRLFSSYLSKALPNIETYQIRAIASQAKVIRYGANSTIVQQGTLADKFYLILAGTAEVLVSDGNNSTSYQIKTGDYFGNTQLIDGEEYPFTVRVGAKADADLMVLDRETFCSVIGVIAK